VGDDRRFDGPATMASEETGWWEVERAHWVRGRVAALTRPGSVIVDVGCGRGTMLGASGFTDRVIVNVDSHRWSEWKERPAVHHVVAAADALPFRDESFDLVGSFDVLEHLVDDEGSVREQARIVRREGTVVAAVPADPKLWSAHDVAVGHQRRYQRASVRALMRTGGLATTRVTGFFSFLWLPALLARGRAARASEPATGGGLVARGVRLAIGALASIERAVLRWVDLPVGTSLWSEARRSEPSRPPRLG
jgi:SAM-dependent methyltransferase